MMKFLFIILVVLLGQAFGFDIIDITDDRAFNFTFSFMFYITVALTAFFVVASFLI